MPPTNTRPLIQVQSDYDDYFHHLVEGWVDRKEAEGGLFRHKKIVISAGPYRSSAVSFRSGDGVISLDFYSALRAGFGGLSATDVTEIIKLL